MAETKRIGSISVVTDSENSYEHIGDVDGGFSEPELIKHIKAHGHHGLCEKMTSMQWQIWDAVRFINAEKESKESNKAVSSPPDLKPNPGTDSAE